MAKQRMISTSFWDEDDYIQTLNAEETYFFLYLLTNPKTSLCGIYKLLLGHAVLETKLSKDQVLNCFKKFQVDGKIIREDSWVILVNRKKHNQNSSPKISRGIEREMENIPEEIKALAYGIDSASIPRRKSKVKVKSELKLFKKEGDEYKFSKLLFDLIIKNYPTHKFAKLNEDGKEEQIQKFCQDMDAVLRIDGRDPEHVDFLIQWCQQSPFWKKNILSMSNFREKFDRLVADAKYDFEKVTQSNSKNSIA